MIEAHKPPQFLPHPQQLLLNVRLYVFAPLGQRRDGKVEPPLLTCGKDLSGVRRLLRPGQTRYSAREVLEFLLGESPAGVA